MNRLAWLFFLCAYQDDPRRPEAIRTRNVPQVSEEVWNRLSQYQSVRSASFEAFLPDGSLLITTRFGNTAQLHVVPSPGGRREQITFREEPVADGEVMPATGAILYAASRGGSESDQIYRLDRSSGRSVLLTEGKSKNDLGAVQKSGRRVTLQSNRRNGRDTDTYLLDPATGETTLLLETKGEYWYVADWSPDDSKALLVRYVSVNESYPHLLDPKSGGRIPIPIPGSGKAAHSALAFDSDGRHAYVVSDAIGEFKHLARVDLKTMEYDWLTRDIPWDVTDLEVRGPRVAFVVNEDGRSRLYVMEEGKRRELPLPLGTISGLRFSGDGARLGFSLARPDAPRDAYTFELAKNELVRWTYSEVGGLDPSRFVVPERLRVKSFDGAEIPAYIFRSQRSGRSPVIIAFHGGPEGQYRPDFSSLLQFYVNELGCAVLCPNVRGSTGYGKTFVTLDNGVKREDSVRDVGAILDWIATQRDLDADRVGVVGGSYGGYMVLATLVNYPDRIRAGVDIVGIANFVTFLEKTAAYRQDLRRAEYGDERDPEVRKVLEKISPIHRADRIRAQLLVIHGKNDPRVPVGEAEQIAQKVPGAWLLIAENEGHGFAKKENQNYSSAVTVSFFRKHLLP